MKFWLEKLDFIFGVLIQIFLLPACSILPLGTADTQKIFVTSALCWAALIILGYVVI